MQHRLGHSQLGEPPELNLHALGDRNAGLSRIRIAITLLRRATWT